MVATTAPRGKQNIGIAIAVLLHILVIGLLSVQWTVGDRRFDNPPMEVDLVAETAAQSSAPVISETPPAARLGEEYSEDIAVAQQVPAPPVPEPIMRPTPAPAPKQVARPVATPKQTPPATLKAAPKATPKAQTPPKQGARPTGRLDGIVDGLGRTQTKSTQTKGAPAATTAAEMKRVAELAVNREIQPYWRRNAPSGYEVDELRLTLEIRLRPDGSVIDMRQIGDLGGKTESNAPQQQRFIEQAKKSVTQAAPFEIPPTDFDGVIVVRQPFRIQG